MTVDNLFVCLLVDTCVYMLASSVYTIDLTDDIVDTSEERLLFFDVQKKKERTRLLNVYVRIFITVPLEKQTELSIIFILRIKKEKEFRKIDFIFVIID